MNEIIDGENNSTWSNGTIKTGSTTAGCGSWPTVSTADSQVSPIDRLNRSYAAVLRAHSELQAAYESVSADPYAYAYGTDSAIEAYRERYDAAVRRFDEERRRLPPVKFDRHNGTYLIARDCQSGRERFRVIVRDIRETVFEVLANNEAEALIIAKDSDVEAGAGVDDGLKSVVSHQRTVSSESVAVMA